MQLEIHHVGTLVRDISEAKRFYGGIFGEKSVSDTFFISSQQVHVCFVNQGNNFYWELVQPASRNSKTFGLLKKGITFYHIGYLVANFDAAIDFLCSLHFKPLEQFRSEAFENKQCIFLISPEAHLVELIEK